MKLLREPLLHFLVLGAALFAVYAWRHPTGGDSPATRRVHVRAGDVRWLEETWTRQWQREPTPVELRALLREYLREELLSREAREMGLDRDDTYVRRRLAQKVEFLVSDVSRLVEPKEEELRGYYDAHPELFAGGPRASFTQVYFTREHRSEAVAALTRLAAGADAMEHGDVLLLEAEFRETSPDAVSAQFGPKFSEAVFALEPGAWHGPIESGYGFHLVRVGERATGKTREFSAVRSQVIERWREGRRREDEEKFFAGLLDKYDVVLEESVAPLVEDLVRAKAAK